MRNFYNGSKIRDFLLQSFASSLLLRRNDCGSTHNMQVNSLRSAEFFLSVKKIFLLDSCGIVISICFRLMITLSEGI